MENECLMTKYGAKSGYECWCKQCVFERNLRRGDEVTRKEHEYRKFERDYQEDIRNGRW